MESYFNSSWKKIEIRKTNHLDELADLINIRRMIASLRCLTSTRPNIGKSWTCKSRFMESSYQSHLQVAKSIL